MNNNIVNFQSKWNLGNMQVFSYGNRKLPEETLIVNITSAIHCPSDNLGLCHCSKVCYAKKCERIYKAYLNKNLLVESYMYLWNEAELRAMLLCYIYNAPVKIKYVRLNEAGDFPNQDSIKRWTNIATWLWRNLGIKTYCYTCREDLDFSNAGFIVNASTANIPAYRHFLCVDHNTFDNLPKEAVTCKGDCKLCKLCYDSKYKGNIYCRQH